RFNIQNCMAAVAAGFALGLSGADIRAGLTTFNPTPGQNPGRLNLFEIQGTRVLLDFAHNVPALRALDQVLDHLVPRPGGRILRVGYLAGNRLEDDLLEVGAAMAAKADELWVSDPDPRGRAEGETSEIIARGALESGMPEERVHRALDEWDNIHQALKAAQPGDLVVLQVEDVQGVVSFLRERQRGLAQAPEVTR
ncbi:MAG: cyanophycin synthetase, partial [Candidatus Thermoplasmatota archaeon]|nr:cyanophycin synthetase [Candidatus Thermoplasmatota archaeon]